MLLSGCTAGARGDQRGPAVMTPPASASTAVPTAAAPAPASPTRRTPLVVFCAGSLIGPFADLEAGFEVLHPEIDVLNECHGSIQVIRHVTELHEAIDVVATADAALIPLLMYQSKVPETGQPYAGWYVRFASNRLALAYSEHSQYGAEITADNWYQVLARPGVSLGLADPRFDAAGYRGLMVLKLAEGLYHQPGIFKGLLRERFQYPISAFEDDSGIEIRVPEILETRPAQADRSRIVIRGASLQLIALLESGDLDYAFEYESVIRQHGLRYVLLPAALNLGNPGQAENYGRVTVKLDFQRFASVKPVFRGETIGYGITIPSNAPHPQAAASFIAYLLSPEGQAIMEQNYQPLLSPPGCDGAENMPDGLQTLCKPVQ